MASDRTQNFLDAANRSRLLDVSAALVHADPKTVPFASGHVYFSVKRWTDARHVAAELIGHTDQGPIRCFALRYRVSINGQLQKT